MRVEDSEGRTFATSEDVFPELAAFSLETDPTGLQVTLEGQPRTAPEAGTGVVNLTRRLGAPDPQTLGGMTYRFDRWSDGGARQHAIALPPGQTTYTAFYALVTTSTTTTTTSTTTTSTTTSTTTTTIPPLDPFMFYTVRLTRNTPQFPEFGPMTLQDRSGSAGYDVFGPRQLGFPADKNKHGRFDEVTHLVEYKIRPVPGAPDFQNQTSVQVGSGCTVLLIDVKRPVSILVPASQDSDAPVAAPDPTAHSVDHFLCYQATTPRSVARLGLQVDVVDQLRAGRYDLERITKVCNPVAKSGAPVLLAGKNRGEPKPIEPASIRDPSRHLVCYTAKLAPRFIEQDGCGAADPNGKGTRIEPDQKAPVSRRGIHVNDQFGPAQLDTRALGELCIPSPLENP